MKQVYVSSDYFKANQIKSLLEDACIPCFLKNEYLQGAIGEVPPHEVSPEIWLINPKDEVRAKEIISNFEYSIMRAESSVSWHCLNCGESNESQFMLCWKCQTPRDT